MALKPTLMIQGATSDAGKSTLVTGLCRVLYRRGMRVVPFKPQNMALNSAVTVDGGEIGRAQAVQAQAAGLKPHTDMNPILLKPSSDKGAQVIVHGKALSEMNARNYHQFKPLAMSFVQESYARLCEQYDAILVEGAGSPAEINLRANDIANMGFAEAIDCPVLLVADIDKGGVFAHFVGTLELLSPSERDRIQGFIINRFRGDLSLLQPGNDWLQQKTGKPVMGVLPYLHGLCLEAEDALSQGQIVSGQNKLRVIVPVLPRISNHTDFDVLRFHPELDVRFIGTSEEIIAADLIILPGSKNVRADLAWLKDQGWDKAIQKHLRYGGKLIGICGGMQMLGKTICDPLGIEGSPGESQGLGLFDFKTTLKPDKKLVNVKGKLALDGAGVKGYEIHAGISEGPALSQPCCMLETGMDGAMSDDGQILCTYVHGLFDTTEACKTLLNWAGLDQNVGLDIEAMREQSIDRLADTLEAELNVEHIIDLLHRSVAFKHRRAS